MKASFVMFFAYVGMIGVPVLLMALAVAALFSADGAVLVLLILIAAGCIVYGAIGIREAFVHGGKKNETAL